MQVRVAISYCQMDKRTEKRTHALAAKLAECGFNVCIDVLKPADLPWPQFIGEMLESPKVSNLLPCHI